MKLWTTAVKYNVLIRYLRFSKDNRSKDDAIEKEFVTHSSHKMRTSHVMPQGWRGQGVCFEGKHWVDREAEDMGRNVGKRIYRSVCGKKD